MNSSTRAQTLSWAKALYVCAFGHDPEAVWHTTSLRAERPLSFFFRHKKGLCSGAIGLSLPDESERIAESLRVFMAFQHRFDVLADAGVLPPELAKRSLPLLRGRDGVVVARGQGGWLALADEDIPDTPAPWSLGDPLWLNLRLSTPPREALVVVFPTRGTKGFEATLESACGRRRRGLVDVDGGALWFQSAGACEEARESEPLRLQNASQARVPVTFSSCAWRRPAGEPRGLAMRLAASAALAAHFAAADGVSDGVADVYSGAWAPEGPRETASEWELVGQGERVGLRFVGRGAASRRSRVPDAIAGSVFDLRVDARSIRKSFANAGE